jgi:hypothetical protein
MEEHINLQFNYVEICQLLEASTVQEGSALYNKLRAARDAFLVTPKVYGRGLKLARKSNKMVS